MSKKIYGIAYIGDGDYKAYLEDNKHTIQFEYWYSMLRRCYGKSRHKSRTYEDKYVCEEWMNFQTFAKWFDENYYECDGETMCLDKDILYKGNKVYSPKTCVFVPERINNLFIKCDARRGKYPIGVSFNERQSRFYSRCSIYCKDIGKSKSKNLGYFDTPEDSFYKGYKPFKEDYIKEVAEEYKGGMPIILYNAMYKWVVEITD